MMTTGTTSTVIALFESRIAAEKAVTALVEAGFDRTDMSVVARDEKNPTGDVPDIGPHPDISGAPVDTGTGAAVGGLAGFMGGIVALAIPGIGPLLAVGPIAAGLLGATAGAAAGGLYGALKDRGVPEADVSRMTEAIRRGRVLLSVNAPHNQVDQVADLLDQQGALDVDEPGERFDVSPSTGESQIRPLAPGATEAVKLKPGEGVMDKVRQRERRTSVYPGFTGMGPSSTT